MLQISKAIKFLHYHFRILKIHELFIPLRHGNNFSWYNVGQPSATHCIVVTKCWMQYLLAALAPSWRVFTVHWNCPFGNTTFPNGFGVVSSPSVRFTLVTTHRHNKGKQADRHTDTQTHRHTDTQTHFRFFLYKLDMLCILCHCRTSHITIKCFFQGLGSPYFYMSIVPMFSEVKKKKI